MNFWISNKIKIEDYEFDIIWNDKIIFLIYKLNDFEIYLI